MALFNVTIKKRDATTRQSWGNRYILDAADLDAANVSANDIILTREKAMHYETVEFLEVLVSSREAFDSIFVSTPVSGLGVLTIGGNQMPLFCVVEVAIAATAAGRPGRKFYHVGAGVDSVETALNWDNATLTAVTSNLGTMLSDLSTASTPMVLPGGGTLETAIAYSDIRSHQFTKASKRALAGP